MHQTGIKVPYTICVTTEAYQSFLVGIGLREKILLEIERKAFSDMRWEELWNKQLTSTAQPFSEDTHSIGLEKAFVRILRGKISGQTGCREILSARRRLLTNVVCRCTRVVPPDIWNRSYFGPYSSCLGIPVSDRALLYRKELGLDPRQSTMAVVIQEMIDGERSGVVFGMSPMDADQTVIEAVHGLNQDLVDGCVEPHRWILDRTTGAVISFRAAGEAGSTNDERQTQPSPGPYAIIEPPLCQSF